MSLFISKLLNSNGNLVLDTVPVALTAGDGVWSGQMVLPKGVPLTEGEYQLHLHDGKKGRIKIGSNTWEACLRPVVVSFEGAGPLR